MPQAVVIGNLKPTYDSIETDDLGNPKKITKQAKAQLTIKTLSNQPIHRTSYGVIGSRLIVECHILKTWVLSGNNWIAIKFSPSDFEGILKNSSISLTVIETNQLNLIPLTKIMGLRFLAIMDGTITK